MKCAWFALLLRIPFAITNYNFQKTRALFRMLLNVQDEKHEVLLALILSMGKSVAYADFFEEVEYLSGTSPSSDGFASKLRSFLNSERI